MKEITKRLLSATVAIGISFGAITALESQQVEASDINNSINIYYNVVNNLSHNKTNVVLMHDSMGHIATVNALKDIIRYGKENGYTFKAITNDTPVIRHSVNN